MLIEKIENMEKRSTDKNLKMKMNIQNFQKLFMI